MKIGLEAARKAGCCRLELGLEVARNAGCFRLELGLEVARKAGFCLASFGVLFRRLVLGCRYTPSTTGPPIQWYQFFNWGCVGV